MAADLVIKNGWVVTPTETLKAGVAISNEKIVAIGSNDQLPQGKEEIDAKGKHILPGIIRWARSLQRARHDPQRRLHHGFHRGCLRRHYQRRRHAQYRAADRRCRASKGQTATGRGKVARRFRRHRRRCANQHQRYSAHGRGRRDRLQNLLRRNDRQPALPRRRHVHGGFRLYRSIQIALRHSRREPPDHGLLHQQAKDRG